MNPAKRVEIFRRLQERDPAPTTELDFHTPFELLVAVVLSAQATDKSVNVATKRLFAVANTPQAILALGETGLSEYIRSIGLYRTKARNLIATCGRLLEQFDGAVPRGREALESLPGVGRKTANVILNTAFGEPTIAVDTHIFRVANRTGLAPGRNVDEVEHKLLKLVPDGYRKNAHHWLILHGRYVCKARKPDCPICPIADLCDYRAKTTPEGTTPEGTTPEGTKPQGTKPQGTKPQGTKARQGEVTRRSSALQGRASRRPRNDKAGSRPARSRKPAKLST
jgi:endonuclease III